MMTLSSSAPTVFILLFCVIQSLSWTPPSCLRRGRPQKRHATARSVDGVDEFLREFDVTAERGFLLPHTDPLAALPLGCNDKVVRELLATWNSLVDELPSLCGAGVVRDTISRSLFAVDDDTTYTEAIDYLASHSVAALERANICLSFLAHAFIWCDAAPPVSIIPAALAKPWCRVAQALGRPPILTYYSYNACNWRRLDLSKPIELGNICRLNNFFGGQDEEWFSMVHVAIEAIAGRALAACARAHVGVREDDAKQVVSSLEELEATLVEQVAILDRMEERSDPYVYNLRVRVPMSGWTDDRTHPEGMMYEGVPSNSNEGRWRREHYFGETGAQSTLIPAIDAALGLSCDASASADSSDSARAQALVPYLLAMRDYMPPKHAKLITAFEDEGSKLREYAKAHDLSHAFDRCVTVLSEFRGMHLGLAQRFVRQWDKRNDDEVIGTGGTAFMPYLRAHRDATNNHVIGEQVVKSD